MNMLKKLLIALIIIVLALVLIAVFAGSGSDGEPTDAEVSSGGSVSEELLTERTIVFTDKGFSPALLNVVVGDKVLFENQSSVDFWPASAAHPTHEVYSGTSLGEHCPDGAAEAFDACGAYPPGSLWTFTFTKSGTWGYHDHLNARHTGKVIVE